MNKNDFSTEECYELAKYAKEYIEQANNKLNSGFIVLDERDKVIKGGFVIDKTGIPGIGIKSKGKYQHILGGPDQTIITDKKGQETKTMRIRLKITKEEIDDYFKGLRFINSKDFQVLKQAK